MPDCVIVRHAYAQAVVVGANFLVLIFHTGVIVCSHSTKLSDHGGEPTVCLFVCTFPFPQLIAMIHLFVRQFIYIVCRSQTVAIAVKMFI